MRTVLRIERHTRLPVWPAWQGLVLTALSQLGGPFRGAADQLEYKYGGRVCPIPLSQSQSDPFVLLVHHRHAFRRFDFLRPLFSRLILPEGFPAHPHRGFETITYVLPGRGGLLHRDSFGCKMRYGDGAVQWMTAGDGMLHEEMWDVESADEFELYQLWLNLPAKHKRRRPNVQLLVDGAADEAPRAIKTNVVERAGAMNVERGRIAHSTFKAGAVVERLLADGRADADSACGAKTWSPVTIAHIEIRAKGVSHALRIPTGWNALVYVRRGAVDIGAQGDGAATAAHAATAASFDSQRSAHEADGGAAVRVGTYETAYLSRSGETLMLTSAAEGVCDVLVLAGEPINEPLVSQGTMVMNSQAEVEEAVRMLALLLASLQETQLFGDYSTGKFGLPWDHTLDDGSWAQRCENFLQRFGIREEASSKVE